MPAKSTSTEIITLIWAIAHQFQAGYHISSLNGIQTQLVCDGVSRPPINGAPGPPHLPKHDGAGGIGGGWEDWGQWVMLQCGMGELESCVEMPSSKFGLIVAMFTLGCLVGSLSASTITRIFGRIGTLRLATTLSMTASLWFALANTSDMMLNCRAIIGFACGLTGVNVPLLVSELRPNMKQVLGIMNQLSLVLGLISAQAIALPFAEPYAWRWELVVIAVIGAILLFISLFASQEDEEEEDVIKVLEDGSMSEMQRLIGVQRELMRKIEVRHMSIGEVLTSKDPAIRSGLAVIVVTQIAQQLSGISPVVYFSTSILRPVFPGNSGLVAVLILCIKFPASMMTLPILPRLGSRLTLIWSYAIMATAASLLGIGLNYDIAPLSCTAIVMFFLGFGLGPGPVPWVVLSEVLPVEARTAAGSLGLGLCSITGFIISSTFLPFQELLTTAPGQGEGSIFFVFAISCIASICALDISFKQYARALGIDR